MQIQMSARGTGIVALITASVCADALGGGVDLGPLAPHASNPRYFANGDGQAVYLTGSHTWSNMQEEWSSFFPVTFDFDGYLDLLESYNHNFIRMWRREFPKYKYADDADYRFTYPHPWVRTGPDVAGDGEPKFDLTQFNDEYFDRLRERCIAAANRGIYVSIMLFEGHDLQYAQDGWFSHPFNANNNINGVNGDTDGNGQGVELNQQLSDPVLSFQKAYVRKVIDTVNDLDNVLYEICNEADDSSETWQKAMIDYVKDYQNGKPQQHPVIFSTPYFNYSNVDLWNSNADAVSPGEMAGNYQFNPPSSNGSKVVFVDTDHLFACGAPVEWIWKSFTRGLNPLYMDSYYPDTPYCFGPLESVRSNLGYVRDFALRVDMAKMKPRSNHATSGYCLADLGQKYFVFMPGGSDVEVDLEDAPSDMRLEWLNVETGSKSNDVEFAGGAMRTLNSPWNQHTVAFIYRAPPVPEAGDHYGHSVANAGDVNGDGFDDIVIGAPYSDRNGDANTGRVYVKVYSTADNTYYHHFARYGQSANDWFGLSVAGAGDVNGDGYDDIIVGAPRNDQNGSNAGKIYVYSGVDGDLLFSKVGEKAGDQFGFSVSGGLNVNGGRKDVLVGAPHADPNGSKSGAAYVYSGLKDNQYALLKKLKGQNAEDRFGHSIAAVGRTNSDTRDDFVVGAPGNDEKGNNAGKIYLYSGQSFGLRYTKKGQGPNEQFGFSVAGIGRANGDERSDFIVGSPDAKRIDLFSGSNGTRLWFKTMHPISGGRLGFSVAGSGRLNSQSLGIAVGETQSSALWGCRARVFDVQGNVIFTKESNMANNGLGTSVALVNHSEALTHFFVGVPKGDNAEEDQTGTVSISLLP